MDAIGRIRDFALKPAQLRFEPVIQGVASSVASFDSSRRSPRRRAPLQAAIERQSGRDASLAEMCRLARPYGFVVRLDAESPRESNSALKLFRFADRCHPAGCFATFAEAMARMTSGSLTDSGNGNAEQ